MKWVWISAVASDFILIGASSEIQMTRYLFFSYCSTKWIYRCIMANRRNSFLPFHGTRHKYLLPQEYHLVCAGSSTKAIFLNFKTTRNLTVHLAINCNTAIAKRWILKISITNEKMVVGVCYYVFFLNSALASQTYWVICGFIFLSV